MGEGVKTLACCVAAMLAAPFALRCLARLLRAVGHSALWHQGKAVVLVLLVVSGIVTIKAQKRMQDGATGALRPAAALVGRVALNAPVTEEEIARG